MSSVIAKLACFGTTLMDGKDLDYYFKFLKDQLKTTGNEYINTTARCLQMMLRIDDYRWAFVANDGITRYSVFFRLPFPIFLIRAVLFFNFSIFDIVNCTQTPKMQ